MVYESSMGVMSPASGRETPTILARGSSSNTRADSGRRNDADDAAAASPSGSGGILKYLWPPSSSSSSAPVIDSSGDLYGLFLFGFEVRFEEGKALGGGAPIDGR
jgi:hypothetical protein